MYIYRNGNLKIRAERLGMVALLLLVLCSFSMSAQNDRRSRRLKGRGASSEIVLPDKMELPDSLKAKRDSTFRADSISRADSLDLLNKSSLDAPAFTAAKDSIIEDFSNGKRIIHYYGDVSVSYANMKLTADYMEYDLQTQTLFARGTKDTTGVIKGQPVMEQGGKSYTMEEVRYNFATQKARIKNMVTQEQDGILHGKNIKMMPDHSINITNGKYTVCDCEHPHYYLHLTAAKVITKPSQKTVFGPAYPVIGDVPLPIGLPFGFIPKKPDRATGILFPTFGEEISRGFYMRDLGLYFVIGEYFDIALYTWIVGGEPEFALQGQLQVQWRFFSFIYQQPDRRKRKYRLFPVEGFQSDMEPLPGLQGKAGNLFQCICELLQPFQQQVQLHHYR